MTCNKCDVMNILCRMVLANSILLNISCILYGPNNSVFLNLLCMTMTCNRCDVMNILRRMVLVNSILLNVLCILYGPNK